jgi:hypothetical protein
LSAVTAEVSPAVDIEPEDYLGLRDQLAEKLQQHFGFQELTLQMTTSDFQM